MALLGGRSAGNHTNETKITYCAFEVLHLSTNFYSGIRSRVLVISERSTYQSSTERLSHCLRLYPEHSARFTFRQRRGPECDVESPGPSTPHVPRRGQFGSNSAPAGQDPNARSVGKWPIEGDDRHRSEPRRNCLLQPYPIEIGALPMALKIREKVPIHWKGAQPNREALDINRRSSARCLNARSTELI